MCVCMMFRVKESLDKQWERLHMSKVVSAVVPFLPLEREHIEQVCFCVFTNIICNPEGNINIFVFVYVAS